MRTKVVLTASIAGLVGLNALGETQIDFKQDHCVAWKTKKTMALVKKVEPVGINCEIKTTVKKNGNSYQFTGVFPIAKFNSGEPDRDTEVIEILGGKQHPDLHFQSTKVSSKTLAQILKGAEPLKGQLKINGKSHPISFNVTKNGSTITGSTTLTFSQLDVEVPSVAGGLIAKVQDYLELHLRFSTNKIKGFPNKFL